MARLLRLTAEQVASAATRLRTQVRAIDARLVDGRAWLHGDKPTLADLALMASMGPVTLPPGYHSPIPALASMPAPLAALIAEMRTTATGRWTERAYAALGG